MGENASGGIAGPDGGTLSSRDTQVVAINPAEIAEIEAPPDDLKLIQRILGLALRGRILAEERREPTIDNPTPDNVTTLYAKLVFRKEGQLFVPQVIFYSSLSDDYYRSDPDYPFLLSFTSENINILWGGKISIKKNFLAPDYSPSYPQAQDFQLGRVTISGNNAPLRNKSRIGGMMDAHLDASTPQKAKENRGYDERHLLFTFSNHPDIEVAKVMSTKNQELDSNSSDYYDLANGILDLLESATAAAEQLMRRKSSTQEHDEDSLQPA